MHCSSQDLQRQHSAATWIINQVLIFNRDRNNGFDADATLYFHMGSPKAPFWDQFCMAFLYLHCFARPLSIYISFNLENDQSVK